ncbi:MAG TPA: hypothetical protein VII20_19860 [Roseiarcus sp.]|jgi:hypothetical protein
MLQSTFASNRAAGDFEKALGARLKFGKIGLRRIGPDDPRRVILANQRVEIANLKRGLIANRFAQPRSPYAIPTPSNHLRQIIEKPGHDSPSDPRPENQPNPKHSIEKVTASKRSPPSAVA